MKWKPGRLRLLPLLLLLSVCVRVHCVPIERDAAAGGGEQDKEGVAEENVVRVLLGLHQNQGVESQRYSTEPLDKVPNDRCHWFY